MKKADVKIDEDVVGLIKAGRSILHWSQEDLADESEISIATIRRAESRINAITADAMAHLGKSNPPKIRREKVEAILQAFQRNGLTVWRGDNEFGITLKDRPRNNEFFEVAKLVAQRGKADPKT